MLSREQNELLTRTGPGTAGGALLRCYWQPAALAEELTGAALSLRLLAEDLVLTRDAGGTVLLRSAQRAYPTHEAGGLILAYLGAGDPPALPTLPFLRAPLSSVWTWKLLHECNYLQGNEGNVDPQHLSFLHRFLHPLEEDRAFDASRPFWTADLAPRIEVEERPWGLRISAIRKTNGDGEYVRISNFIMPNCSSFLGSAVVDPKVEQIPESSYYHFHWHVPIDDESHWKYRIAFRTDGPVDKAYLDSLVQAGSAGTYDRERRRENRYLQDRGEMTSRTFAGLGFNFHDHDRFAVESQGRISDRTKEHLGATDRAVAAMRKQMLQAIDDVRAGRDPLLVERDPRADPFAGLVTSGQLL